MDIAEKVIYNDIVSEINVSCEIPNMSKRGFRSNGNRTRRK